MNIDDKMLKDLAGQIGMGGKSPRSTSDMISEAKENYSGKSDDQLLQEILKLKQVLKKDRKAFDKQMEMIKSLRPMMSPEQRKKLDGLLKMLDE
ncbi:hypothetical protein Ami103574_13180 [Aminipila butyrica]|uniref:Uncharacterized protein n=1 Tax=Aminipila butyrica TaxID=433296 RepID=A0A858BYH8_9FIRM|nr:hypothetical protein [Aminipila butyrica]QIB70185.1 hypothetical protein Ami103574_13180 [Aminipila butyrica]